MNREELVQALVNRMADQEFGYGSCDCFVFTATLVRAWHGLEVGRHLVEYWDEASALDYIRRGGGFARLVTAELGPPIRSPLEAADGDVVLAMVGRRGPPALGFVVRGRALFKSRASVMVMPLRGCSLAWRVH